MGVEIERKFLLKNKNWKKLADAGQVIKQGYLNLDKARTVRVRTINGKGILTIKGKTRHTTRLEYEYDIPFKDALELMELAEKTVITKTRYKVLDHGKTWEIDIFDGDNLGLEIAEIELIFEDEKFIIPEWIGQEVSHDSRYYNSSLILNPFKNW